MGRKNMLIAVGVLLAILAGIALDWAQASFCRAVIPRLAALYPVYAQTEDGEVLSGDETAGVRYVVKYGDDLRFVLGGAVDDRWGIVLSQDEAVETGELKRLKRMSTPGSGPYFAYWFSTME